jgi:Leucine-rich repeat (LRR) protein
MKLIFSVILGTSLLIWICSCKKTDQISPGAEPPPSDIITGENNRLSAAVTSQTTTAFVSGTVMDELGKALEGALVTCGNTTITTNNKGYFQFESSLTVNKDYAVIVATLSGYFKGIRTFTPNSSGKANHFIELTLLKTGTAKTVAENGGNIELDNKIRLSFPQAAVVNSSGAIHHGQYVVTGRYIDPSTINFPDIMPGMLAGLNDQNQLRALQSFGMMSVELKDASGNVLQIAPGKTVTMELPAPSNGPATIPLWHFNEKYGLWIKTGEAIKGGDKYTAEVNHFSSWNLDLEFNSFKLEIQFKDPSGNVLAGLHGQAYTEGVNKIVSFYSDDDGKITLINCPSSKPLTVKTFFQCDTVARSVEPVTASRTEIIIVSPGAGIKSYKIEGKLSGCNNEALANRPFTIATQADGSSLGLPGVTDVNGNYTVTGMLCYKDNEALLVQAMAFVDGEYRYAPAAYIDSASSIYNAQLCDTSASPDDNFQIIFPDQALDALIRAAINKPLGVIEYKDIKGLDTLIGTTDAINDLAGIQFCTGLKVFDFPSGANLTDLGLLKNLLSLQRLSVWARTLDGGITDIAPLQNLTQLRELDLRCPNLSDYSTLQHLVRLQTVTLTSKSLSNVSSLSSLSQLTKLSLSSDALRDLGPLSNLTGLKSLTIQSSSLASADLDVLKNLNKLESLSISHSTISDFSVVKDLPALLYLYLDWNQISDVSQFAASKSLVRLDLTLNSISDISSLQALTQLEYLNLTRNQITDINALRYMPLLETFIIESNKISDLSPLQNLSNLQLLWMNFNRISNIEPLINGVPNLKTLLISGQETGPIGQRYRDDFKATHPSCQTTW